MLLYNIRCVALMQFLWGSMSDSLGSSLRYPLAIPQRLLVATTLCQVSSVYKATRFGYSNQILLGHVLALAATPGAVLGEAQAAKTQKTIMEDSKFKFMQCAYYNFRPGSYCVGRVASGPMKGFSVYTGARYQWASTCRAVLALHVKWLENSRRQNPKYVPRPRYRDAYGLEGYQGDVLSLAAAAKAPPPPPPPPLMMKAPPPPLMRKKTPPNVKAFLPVGMTQEMFDDYRRCRRNNEFAQK